MGIHRPNVYGNTLQWFSAYSIEENAQLIESVNTPVPLVRSAGIFEDTKNMGVGSNNVVSTKVAGRFMLQIHGSFSGSVNDDYSMYWYINTIQQSAGKIKWTQKGGNYWAISSQVLLELQEDDSIDLYIENNSDSTNITLSAFNMTIFKIW